VSPTPSALCPTGKDVFRYVIEKLHGILGTLRLCGVLLLMSAMPRHVVIPRSNKSDAKLE
jgi:hypothetical protein